MESAFSVCQPSVATQGGVVTVWDMSKQVFSLFTADGQTKWFAGVGINKGLQMPLLWDDEGTVIGVQSLWYKFLMSFSLRTEATMSVFAENTIIKVFVCMTDHLGDEKVENSCG